MEDRLTQAFERWSNAVEIANEFAHDGFKAPEQIIETIASVMNAAWELQIEWCAMLRANRAKE